ncbi:uncharacterized protein LOC107046742 [Diachasma alloeum]|uniref:uncharacterized protein LOC107046742 n=1 Tax=Diachasma alloeum TaxID=454923 RepID=UPI0007381DAD|nr:uncharacterized protein LOC107046742 [Diachasma alloeum]
MEGNYNLRQRRCREKKKTLDVEKELERVNSIGERTTEKQGQHNKRKNQREELLTSADENQEKTDEEIRVSTENAESRKKSALRQQRCRMEKRRLDMEKEESQRDKNRERQRQCRARKRDEAIRVQVAETNRNVYNAIKQKRYRTTKKEKGKSNCRIQKVYRMKKKYCFNETSVRFNDQVRENYLGAMDVLCKHCGAKHFAGRRPGPYCFMVQGQIYYQMNTALYPERDDGIPRYGQLFMLDADMANDFRMTDMKSFDISILHVLDSVLRRENHFVNAYYMMREVIEMEEKNCEESGTEMPEIKMVFNSRKKGMDKHRYNPQRTNEVAAVFTTTADGEIPESYVTIVNRTDKKLKFVSTLDPSIEPWIYPLFYPLGLGGYDVEDTRYNCDRRISRSAYVKDLIAVRNGFNPILHGRKLFQQWIVDNYVKVERDRTNFIRFNQKKLRCETYQGLVDYLERRGEENDMRVGKIVILPSTFIGSPRNMAQNYQDAMAIVRKYGKPDLFITMTCNPRWREIEENLGSGEQPSDRPDIAARIFDLKKNYLLDLILINEIFGRVLAWVYVIEFQKRGLPHVHMLVTLSRNCRLTSPNIVDKFISAEIPDRDEQPALYNIVMKNMIHGPCGDWCLVDNKCSKHFPKAFQEETSLDGDGYPCYRRRDTDEYHEKQNGYVVDNRYVVPYCPEILLQLNCHCNVEVVSHIRAVKYFFKYIHKSHDAADVIIEEISSTNRTFEHDEIKQHIDSRYVGPVEAAWRLLHKKLHDKSHAIIRLPIHLPNQQSITINPGGEECDLAGALEQQNMLLDYFALNIRDANARKYLYIDIPEHYTFDKKKANNRIIGWKPRKASFKTIGRMYSINPSQVELFHLRLLLCNVKGAMSFNDLRSVDGRLLATFTEACVARGLIQDDHEWTRAMEEGEVWMMPQALRQLFACILLHCQPLYPDKLWDEFKIPMSEDFMRKMTPAVAENRALWEIARILQGEDKNLSDYNNMPEPLDITEQEVEIDFEKILARGNEQYEQLNEEQKNIIDEIISNIRSAGEEERSTCFYINGPGGSGKTFIYDTLWHLMIGEGKKVKTMAFTGIAATLLPEGKTVHKTFGLPVPLYQDSTSSIKINSKKAKELGETDVFIWDEAPMSPKYCLDVIDRLLKDIMDNDIAFGGKLIVMGGDFRQLLPVLEGGTRSETVSLSIKYSPLWRFFRTFTLHENMRAFATERKFSNYLIALGNGELNDERDRIDLPDECIADRDRDIVLEMYEELISQKKYKSASKVAILSARNDDVDEINQRVIDLLDIETERIYTSVDSTENCNDGNQEKKGETKDTSTKVEENNNKN